MKTNMYIAKQNEPEVTHTSPCRSTYEALAEAVVGVGYSVYLRREPYIAFKRVQILSLYDGRMRSHARWATVG